MTDPEPKFHYAHWLREARLSQRRSYQRRRAHKIDRDRARIVYAIIILCALYLIAHLVHHLLT